MVSKSGRSLASSFELVLSSKIKSKKKTPKAFSEIFTAHQNQTTGPIKPLVNGYLPLTTKSTAS